MVAVDEQTITDFLCSIDENPSALVVEGEAGIGKTTLWLRCVDQALERGIQVLSTRPVAAESVLAYTALADLLSGVDPTVLGTLPEPQRLAMDQVLLRTTTGGLATDQRAVAAAFQSIVTRLSDDGPVLLALDDLQWLDSSSVQAISFVTRRLSGPVGVLGAVRTDPATGTPAAWLQLPRPEAVQRIQVPSLTLGGVSSVLAERLGRSFSRRDVIRIHDVSGGNPFYALELARTMREGGVDAPDLPSSLAELVQARLGGLGDELQGVLLAAACATAPTVDLIARVTNADAATVVGLLEGAEASGIVEITGHRLRFTHPLLAQGVYTKAVPAQRREMHRRLANIVTQPELQARHLALGATTSDPVTLQSLDEAAEIARRRGAPAAAAELLDLAMGLGGNTSERQLLVAKNHLDAGDLGRARVLLEETIEALPPGVLRAEALTLLALVRQVDDSFVDAVVLLTRALSDTGDDLALRVETLVAVSYASLLVGDLVSALRYAEAALVDAERLGQSQLLGQALGVRVMLGALHGEGVDEAGMRRALTLEDTAADVTVFYRPCFNNVMVLSWLGRIDEARIELDAIRSRCLERGEETALIVTAFNYVVGAGWLGALPEATLVAEDAMERALLIGGDQSLMMAWTSQAVLAAYAGRVDDARRFGAEATAASYRGGALFILGYQLTAMGFLEVSLNNYAAALMVLEPLIHLFHESPQATEIGIAWFLPDAVESFVALGRLDEAEPLVAALERNGARLDRGWMLAMGARGRAMLLAARGDVDGASAAAQQAMSQHDRLPMPFERARTQLLLGQLLRRQKQKDAAAACLREALATFETLGTPLWADKARAALARSNVGPKTTPGLTPSEQRVAELAASGMTNREVAAELFISPKTVEANLSRIYHKLGIRSRAELGRVVGRVES